MGIIDQIGSWAGTDRAKAINLAHDTFQNRMGEHGHTGKALVESLAEVCRNHPNIVGLAVGLMVEQFLLHEKHVHDAHLHDAPRVPAASHAHAPTHAAAAHQSHPSHWRLDPARIKPGKIGFDVFAGLIALKFGAAVARMFGRQHRDAWFAPAARMKAFSAGMAAYYAAKAIKAPKISAWRNAAILFWGTNAIKPVLKLEKKRRLAAAQARAAAPLPAPAQRIVPPPAAHDEIHVESHAPEPEARELHAPETFHDAEGHMAEPAPASESHPETPVHH